YLFPLSAFLSLFIPLSLLFPWSPPHSLFYLVPGQDRGHFTCGCFLGNSRYLLSGSSDGLLMLWDLKNKNSTKTIEGHSSPVTAVASASSDQLVLSAGQDKTLVLHSLSSSHSLQNTVNLSTKDTAEQVKITCLQMHTYGSKGQCNSFSQSHKT
ncbi:p21-activated protein kinase-interacting protein 1, partial [Geodia barretti]